MRKFEIEVNNKKKHEISVFSRISKNLPEMIDLLLLDLRPRELNLGVWFNEEMTYGEIVTLNDSFEEEAFITIIEKEKL